jgi:hypothetical protein
MIEFKRDDNMSIYLSFDEQGLVLLCNAIEVLQSRDVSNLDVSFDRSVATMKRSSAIELINMSIARGETTTMAIEDSGLVWTIEDEDLDCLGSLLAKCRENGNLETPELIRVQVPKNKKLDYLYGTMIGSIQR